MQKEQWLQGNNNNERKNAWLKQGEAPKKYGATDFIFDVLELPVNITASTLDLLHDRKMDRDFLDNTFSAMLADHQKSKGKDMGVGDHVTGFALDLLLDPTTYLGVGVFSKVGKLDDALKIAKGAGKIADIGTINKVEDALKILSETKTVLDLTNKTGKKAFKTIEVAENLLKNTEAQAGIGRAVINRNLDLQNQQLNEYLLDTVKKKNNLYLITPENWNDEKFFQKALVSDDVKLIKTPNSQKQHKAIKKVVEANYSPELKKVNADLQKYDKVAKGLNYLIDEGTTTLTEKQINNIAKKTGLPTEKAKYALDDYKKNIEKLESVLHKEAVSQRGIAGLENFYKIDTINELIKTDSAMEELIKRTASQNKIVFEKAAEQNGLKQSQFYDNVINYIETGQTGKLNKESLKVAEDIKKTFEQLNDIDRAVLGKNTAYIKDKKYIPRRIKTDDIKDIKEFQEFNLSKSKERTTRDQTFFELRNELEEKGLELNNDLIELISTRTRSTKNRVKHSSLQEGIKAYRSNTAGKGLVLTDHKDLAKKIVEERSVEEFIQAIKGAISEADFNTIKNLNWKAIKESLPKLIGKKQAKKLIKNHGRNITKIQSYLPKPVLDKLKPIIYKNSKYNSPLEKSLNALSSYMQIWKKWTLAPVPTFHVNSFIDNTNLLFSYAPESFLQTKNAFNIMQGKNIILKTPTGNKILNLDNMIEFGITGGKYSLQEFDKITKKKADSILGKIGEFIKGDNLLIEKGFELGNKSEDFTRIMYALSEVEKGLDLTEASKSIKRLFYDPSEITEFTRYIRDHLMPFAPWAIKNIKTTPYRYGKSIGRTIAPIKAINASRADEKEFIISDQMADNPLMFRINRKRSMDLTPKFSQLDLISIIESIENNDNILKGTINKLEEYLGPYRGLIGAIKNHDVRRDSKITTLGKETEDFLWVKDVDKRVISAIKSQVRITGIIDNILRDEENNFIWDTFKKYGSEKGNDAIKKSAGYLLLGSSFTRDLERSGERAIREAGARASTYKREALKARKKYLSTRDVKDKEKYNKLMNQSKEENENIRTLRKELPKLKKEQREINKYIGKKYQIPSLLDGVGDLFNALQKKTDNTLKTKTEVKLLEVLDGDSIKVELPNGQIEYVRLAGIDSPEQERAFQKNNIFYGLSEEDNKAMYLKSKEALESLLRDQKFYIQRANKSTRDIYDRPVVRITKSSYESGEIDINKHLIKNGYAKPAFLEELKDPEYAQLLKESAFTAEEDNVGFWNKMENKERYKNLLYQQTK